MQRAIKLLETLRTSLPVVRHFIINYYQRCNGDQITITAGYLSFVSLLSLVPLITVMLSVVSAFPVFTSVKDMLQEFVFSNFLPTSGEQVQNYINSFVDNASKMTAVGILFLVGVALSLISAIDKSLNQIWSVKEKRKMVISFAIYWMVLTLGPVFIGASVGATSYLISIADSITPGFSTFLIKLLPFAISTTAFALLYMTVPNTDVGIKPAFFGGVVAAVLFELTKRVFALYITSFPSYEVIYGALATIPILFLWVYLSWIVVLLGAEATVTLEQFTWKEDEHSEDLPINSVQ